MENKNNSIKLDGNNNVVITSVKDSEVYVNTILWDEFKDKYTKEKDDQINDLRDTVNNLKEISALSRENKIYLESEIVRLNEEIVKLKHEKDIIEIQLKRLVEEYSNVDISQKSEKYKQAYSSFLDGNIKEAIEILSEDELEKEERILKENQRRALESANNLAESRILKAQLLALSYRFDEAASNYEKAMEIAPSWRTFQTAAFFYSTTGQYKEAEKVIEDCMQRFVLSNQEKASSLSDLGLAKIRLEKFKEAENNFETAYSLLWNSVNEEDLVMNSYLSAGILNNLSLVQKKIGKHKEAIMSSHRAVSMYEGLDNDLPEFILKSLALSYANLCNYYAEGRNYDEAETHYLKAYQIRKNILNNESEADKASLASILGGLSTVYQHISKYTDSEYYSSQAVKLYEEIVEKNPHYKNFLATSYARLASVYVDTNEFSKAEFFLKKSIETWRSLSNDQLNYYLHDYAKTLYNASSFYRDIKRIDLAQTYLDEAIGIIEKLHFDNQNVYNLDLAKMLNSRANLLDKMNNIPMAERDCLNSLDIYSQLNRENNLYAVEISTALSTMGNIQVRKGDIEKALKCYRQSLAFLTDISEKNPTSFLKERVYLYINLAHIYTDTGDFQNAEYFLNNAIDLHNEFYGLYPELNIYSINILAAFGRLYSIWKRYDLSEEYFEKALAVLRKEEVTNRAFFSGEEVNVLCLLANVKNFMKKFDEAESLYIEAERMLLDMVKSNGDHIQLQLSDNYINMALFYADRRNDLEMAKEYALKALEIIEPRFNMLPNHNHKMTTIYNIINRR